MIRSSFVSFPFLERSDQNITGRSALDLYSNMERVRKSKKTDPTFFLLPPFADSNKAEFLSASSVLLASSLNKF